MNMIEGYGDLENSIIVDKNGEKIGKIVDFVMDENYKITNYIIEGENEEIRQNLNLSSKYKLLLPKANIRRTKKNTVYTNIIGNDLKSMIHIADNEIRFNTIKEIDVLSADGEYIGTVNDAIIHRDDHISLIIVTYPQESFISKIGLKSPMQLFLPYRYIQRLGPNIILINKNKEDLREVFDNYELDTDGMRIMNARKQASKESRLLLFKESYKDVFMDKKDRI